MVKFIESELVLLKKEIDEDVTLVYNQARTVPGGCIDSTKELAQQVMVRVNAG